MDKRTCKACGAELARQASEKLYEWEDRRTCGGACARRLACANRKLRVTAEDRFWAMVERGDDAECWPWTGSRNRRGYGNFRAGGRTVGKAHRFSWELHFGPIPAGGVVRHDCDNPPCCNPAHLRLGSHRDNADDREIRGRTLGVTVERMPASDIAAIKSAKTAGVTQHDIARAFGVSQPYVSRVVRGLRRRLH